MKTYNIDFNNNYFDIKVANYLIDSSRRDDFVSVLKTNLNIDYNDDQKNKRVFYIKNIYNKLFKELKEHNLINLFYNIEMPLSKILMEMEFEGVNLVPNLLSLVESLFFAFKRDFNLVLVIKYSLSIMSNPCNFANSSAPSPC